MTTENRFYDNCDYKSRLYTAVLIVRMLAKLWRVQGAKNSTNNERGRLCTYVIAMLADENRQIEAKAIAEKTIFRIGLL